LEEFFEKVGFDRGVKERRSDGLRERGWWHKWVEKWMRRWIKTRVVRLTEWMWSWFQRRGDAYL